MRLGAAFACLALCLSVHAAVAQDSAAKPAVQAPLLTLDDERLFSGSAFGKAVIARQDADSRTLIDENRRIEAALEVEEKDLTTRRASMTREEFMPLSDAFNQKVEGIRKAQDAKTRDLQRRFEEDRLRFLQAARPILAEVMTSRGAVAIIDSRAVFVGFENIDITDEAISRLDAAFAAGQLTPGTP
jgi:Skp family chaperone for outer membrane proteins